MIRLFCCAVAFAAVPFAASAQDDASDLAKKLANPIADLVSLPLQFNWNCCFGPDNGNQYVLNIQPVIPISLTDDWNLITRTIVPLEGLERTSFMNPGRSGFGDTTQSFFLSPKSTESGIVWGVGPVFLWPTGSDGFSSRKWGAGPTGVVLYQADHWTIGGLANHIWSYAGAENAPEVNATFLNPFLTYSFGRGATVTLQTQSTYDWTNSTWNVPITLTLGQIVPIFHQPVQFQIGPTYWAETPSGDPDWGVRFQMTFLFPK